MRQIAALLLCVLLMYSSSFAATQPAPVILYDINGNPYNASGGGGGGGSVTAITIASAVTTDTSTTPVAGVSGVKNFQWKVTGSGTVTQTAVLNGSFDADGSSPTALCTIALSGTAPVVDACPPFTAPFPYLFVTTTVTTGTNASGTGKVGY